MAMRENPKPVNEYQIFYIDSTNIFKRPNNLQKIRLKTAQGLKMNWE